MPIQTGPPPELFQSPPTLRVLRLDRHWRYAALQAKAHGDRPDSRRDWCMEGFAANYVLRGGGVHVCGDGSRYPLAPGTLFQRLPGRRHSTLLDPASDYAELFLVLDRRTAEQMLGLGLIVDDEVRVAPSDPGVWEAFVSLRRELARPEADLSSRQALLLIAQFLTALYERARHAHPGGPGARAVHEACVLLERDLDRRIDVGDVARALGVAYPTFRRRFRQAVGVAPGAYRVRCRLEQARVLLLDNPVGAVAERLGYADAFTFSAQFKSHFGLSPRHFQDQQRRERR